MPAIALAVAGTSLGAQPANPASLPPELLGEFRDDYGNAFQVSDSLFFQLPRMRFRIVEWNVAERFLIAQNDSTNPGDPGFWTRIDWMPFSGMAPYTWGFCLTAYKAPTAAAARATPAADRTTPRTGCGGFPFSRMRRPDERLVSSGGRAWWVSCAGAGSPFVLLEAGHGEGSETWREVQAGVASFTRVCSYDRAGLGRSPRDPARGPRTGAQVAADLDHLLAAAGEMGPRILVGHSLGGAFVRLSAAAGRHDVRGLVLVDAVSEREIGAIDSLLTPAQRAAGAGMRPMSPEGIDVEAVLRELATVRVASSLPLTVIARGRPLADDEMPPDWSPEQRSRREAVRRAAQNELARLSSRGTLVFARGSGHFVHHDEPEVVIAAIRALVEASRRELRR